LIIKRSRWITENIFFLSRHGIRQLRTGWADGPAYVTQCPIQPGQSYVYNFTITGQRGTLLWHAHINWLRATVHGAIVILPKRGVPYPFPTPHKEVVVILGELKKLLLMKLINSRSLRTILCSGWNLIYDQWRHKLQLNGGNPTLKP
jgi:hypothetical protein